MDPPPPRTIVGTPLVHCAHAVASAGVGPPTLAPVHVHSTAPGVSGTGEGRTEADGDGRTDADRDDAVASAHIGKHAGSESSIRDPHENGTGVPEVAVTKNTPTPGPVGIKE